MIAIKINQLIARKNLEDGRAKTNLGTLAEEIGISRNTLYLWMQPGGIKQVSINTLDALCKYFDCGVGDILEYVPDQEPKA